MLELEGHNMPEHVPPRQGSAILHRLAKMAEESQDPNNAEKNPEQSKEVPFENDAEEEPDFDDPEGFVDDVSEEELLEDLLKSKPKEIDGVESVVVVDGIPVVGPERLEKLKNVIKKIFSQFGMVVTEYYPVDESGKTKGYAFMEFTSGDYAREAVKSTNGYRLDKQHVFSVNLFTDFDKYENISKDWVEPEVQPYIDHGNLRSWLLEPNCYDQYSVIYEAGGKTAVYYNSQPEPILVKERERWTETCVSWSPLGTYLSTFHQRGIALWGGEDFKQIMKFSHVGVQFIDFSPCEKYVVTFSSLPETRDDPQSIIIWDIRSGAKKRTFSSDNHQTIWPVFKWSHDDKYFARMGTDVISIYETPSFGLLDKKSVKSPGIRNFSWSPTQNIMGYWVAEDKDTPARVTLLEIPSRTELRTKNLFNVADCKMHWQKAGEFLCMKVDRYTKAKKEKDNEWKYSGLYYNFEIFHMKEKQIPVDSIEFKENIMAFSWEPVGGKFAIIHGDAPHISVSFYGIKTGGTVVFQKKFERKQCNHLFWSPNGQFIVLAGLRSMSGMLEFVDTSDYTVMAQTEHYMAMDVEWDPTGRYVITAVSYWGGKVDHAFWVWSFQGKLINKNNLDRFCQLLWRPRPPTLLSDAKIKEIKKSLSTKYSTQFDNTDKLSQSKASRELIDKRRKLMEEFKTYRKRKEEEFAAQKKYRLELRDNVDTDEVDSHSENLEEEKIEFFVKEEVTIIEEEE